MHYTNTRSTREAHTNFPNALSQIYTSSTPRHKTKQPLLPPILSPTSNNQTSTQLKKILFEKRIMRDISTNREKKEKILKGKVAESLWNQFNLFINPKWLNESLENILERAYYMYKIREINYAASKIQKKWKNYVFCKGQQEIQRKKVAAARKIQRMWRVYMENKVRPRLQAQREFKAAIIIQKYYRAYSARMKYSVMLGRKRIKENLKYFENVWDEIIMESVIVIQKFWRKYLAKKKKAKPSKKQVGNRFARTVKAARKNLKKK